MSAELEATLSILRAGIIVGTFTVLYRKTTIYAYVEHLVMGVVSAILLVSNVEAIQKGAGTAFDKLFPADPVKTPPDAIPMIALLFGILFLTFFVARLRYLYRLAAMVSVATMIGLAMPRDFQATYANITSYARLKDFGDALMLIMYLFVLSYYIFMRKLEVPLAIPRRIGIYIIYVYVAMQLPASIFRWGDPLAGAFYNIVYGPGVIMLVIGFLWLLYDYFLVRGRAPTAAVRQPVKP